MIYFLSVGDDDAVEAFGASARMGIIGGVVPESGFGKFSKRLDVAVEAFEPVDGAGRYAALSGFGCVAGHVPAADDFKAGHDLADQAGADITELPVAV